MKKYNDEFDDYNVVTELTSDSYLTFTTDCAKKVKETSDRILTLTIEFDDKNRIIKVSKEQIQELKQKIAVAKEEKKEISREIKDKRRSLKVDLKFLNKLNNSMNRNSGGAHLVEYQKRKVR